MKLKLGRRKIRISRREILGFLLGMLVVGAIYEGMEYMKSMQKPVSNLTYQNGGVSIRWLPGAVLRWNSEIDTAAKKYNVDANLIAIIMTIESGGYSKANSGVANGLMQVTGYTGGDIAKKFLLEPRDDYDLFDPATSIEFGAAYIAHLRDTFCTPEENLPSNECVELIAAGYNGGPGAAGNLYRGEGLKDMETVGYSRDARNMWRERLADSSPTYTRWLERGGQSLVDAAQKEAGQ